MNVPTPTPNPNPFAVKHALVPGENLTCTGSSSCYPMCTMGPDVEVYFAQRMAQLVSSPCTSLQLSGPQKCFDPRLGLTYYGDCSQ